MQRERVHELLEIERAEARGCPTKRIERVRSERGEGLLRALWRARWRCAGVSNVHRTAKSVVSAGRLDANARSQYFVPMPFSRQVPQLGMPHPLVAPHRPHRRLR